MVRHGSRSLHQYLFIAGLILTGASGAGAATYLVDDPGDVDDGLYGVGQLTLREAISLANASAGLDDIQIDAAITLITPASPLPAISENLDISAMAALTVIDGAPGAVSGNGLDIQPAAGVNLTRLHFTGFTGHGVNAEGPVYPFLCGFSGNGQRGISIGAAATMSYVDDCTVGIGPDGMTGVPNGAEGIAVFGADTNIEGTLVANSTTLGILVDADTVIIRDCMVIGNGSHGIQIEAAGTRVLGSTIGMDGSGSAAPNGGDGVHATASALAPLEIGGTLPADLNHISGNSGHGILLTGGGGFGSLVRNNYIGLNQAGDTAVPNSLRGIHVEPTVAGGLLIADNFVSGNQGDGIYCGASDVTIENNRVGLDGTELSGIGNSANGINIESGATNIQIVANVISGSSGFGILADSPVVIRQNIVGMDPTTNTPIGNDTGGIELGTGSGGTVIGGPDDFLDRNLIGANPQFGIRSLADVTIENNIIGEVDPSLGNMGDGIVLIGSSTASTIHRNQLLNNQGEGILIGLDRSGVAITEGTYEGNTGLPISLNKTIYSNDNEDLDTGANSFQNFPTIGPLDMSALEITATLRSAPTTDYAVDLYESNDCHFSGRGAGGTRIDTQFVQTDGSGVAPVLFAIMPTPGSNYTATARNTVTGDTSAFSPCVQVEGTPLPAVSDVTRNGAYPNPATSGNTVGFDVAFDRPVTGVDSTDFAPRETGDTSGSAVFQVLSPFGRSAMLDATSGFRTELGSGPAGVLAGDFTIEFWARIDATPTTPAAFYLPVAFGATEAFGQFFAFGYDEELKLTFATPGVTFSSEYSFSSPGEWHHYAATYDNTLLELILYRDAIPFRTVSGALFYSGTNEMVIGLSSSFGNFLGSVDEVRLWNFARSPAALAATMHAPLDGDEPSLFAYYNFDAYEDLGLNGDGVDDIRDMVGSGGNDLDADGITSPLLIGAAIPASLRTVTSIAGPGDGTLGLDVLNDGTITDLRGFALSAGNNSGEVFTVNAAAAVADWHHFED